MEGKEDKFENFLPINIYKQIVIIEQYLIFKAHLTYSVCPQNCPGSDWTSGNKAMYIKCIYNMTSLYFQMPSTFSLYGT